MAEATATGKGAQAGELREVPGPNSRRLKRKLLDHEIGGTYWRTTFDGPERIPVFESQEGIYVTDVDGNQYIETYGAFAASCLGYAPEELIEPVHEQQRKLMHLADMPSEPRAEAAEAVAS
jgi:4-aminobutyrate aminotransferase-like enzyme